MKKTKSLITYQNLNSGKRLINGRNSSLPLDGKVGPSSSKITSLKTYPRLFPIFRQRLYCVILKLWMFGKYSIVEEHIQIPSIKNLKGGSNYYASTNINWYMIPSTQTQLLEMKRKSPLTFAFKIKCWINFRCQECKEQIQIINSESISNNVKTLKEVKCQSTEGNVRIISTWPELLIIYCSINAAAKQFKLDHLLARPYNSTHKLIQLSSART